MIVTFKYLAEFKRLAKDLKKKYKSFKEDYDTFLNELEKNPFGGESLGHHTYKNRMAIAAKGKGKRSLVGAGPVPARRTAKSRRTWTGDHIYEKDVFERLSLCITNLANP